ncbi:MAG: N-acetylmuramoyl-L-alanine amidase [Thermodesulfovibrionales bacterium]|nr:N-acetylmuramoyl-L-alanine amidase [Thermodesulfovibrionales bacterium]
MFIRLQIFFICLFFIIPTFVIAQSDIKATVRAGKHPDYIRVVFTAPIDILNKSSVVLQGNNFIKVDLKPIKVLDVQPFGILSENSSIEMLKGLKISSKDNYFFISYENIDDISVSKLASPPRLVIDIYSSSKKTPEEPEQGGLKKEEKADKEIINTSKKIETILLDAGHGGEDKGLSGQSFIEKDVALSFVKDLSNAMNKNGKKTILTRRQDTSLTIKERNGIIKSKKFDLLISIHVSSTEQMNIYGLNKIITAKDKNPNDDIDYNSIKAQFIKVLSGELQNFVSVQTPDILPMMFIGLKRIGFLIELPNPIKFNYDRKNKERLISAIVKAVNGIE